MLLLVLSGGRVATATGAKPNVIVVQKAQPKRGGQGGPSTPTSISVVHKGQVLQSPFEKVNFLPWLFAHDNRKLLKHTVIYQLEAHPVVRGSSQLPETFYGVKIGQFSRELQPFF